MAFQRVFQRNRALFTAADAVQRAFRQIQILQILQVFENGFSNVEGLGSPGSSRQLLQTFFNGLWESNGQHLLTSLYKYSTVALFRFPPYNDFVRSPSSNSESSPP